ncbi:MAG: SusD/RagB family nutrient-binding outer membrane lipoprotein [Ferruginibacter sp.]
MIHKLKYFIIPVLLLTVTSCKKSFFDINRDPNNPGTVPVSLLLPTVERALGDGLSNGSGNQVTDAGGISQILEVYVHRFSGRVNADQYEVTGSDFNVAQTWNKIYYQELNNLESIITQGTAAGNMQYVGIAKILKGYTFSVLVDVFGDVPFSEANKLRSGIDYPKFDKDSEIYTAALQLINEGIENLQDGDAANPLKPGSDDLIYNGSVAKWVRAAKSIKLKLYTQLRLVQNVGAEVQALVTENDLISKTSEGFMLPYGPNGATDDRNPAFYDYIAGQRTNNISPWFYEIMKGYNININAGLTDPRLPYYFYNQLKPTGVADGDTEYRDGAFVSIYFGSVGPDKDRSQQNSMTIVGIYPAGGKYDDGSAGRGSAASGSGAAPYRFLTYADVLYLKAELIHAGLITGDERVTLQDALTESFKQVDYVVTNFVKPTQAVPALSGTTTATNYISGVLTRYDAGNANKKLEYIMTQKWISSFGSAVDAYTDYRRTGFPVIFNPNDPVQAPNGIVQPPLNGNPAFPGAQKAVAVQLVKAYPLSLPWDQTELETNPNAPGQKNPGTAKVFWMP